MAFIVKANQNSDFTPVPAGVHMGRCFRLVDMGTQKAMTKYGEKEQHKINIAWEIFGEDENGAPLTIKIEGRDMPMIVSKTYTLSINEKAILRRDLESWRGRKFTDNELNGFDIEAIVGKYCMINITHVENDGKTYARVESITPIPAVLKNNTPEPVHENLIFQLSEFSQGVFDKLPKGLQEYICKSAEFPDNTKKLTPTANNQSAADRLIAAFEKCTDYGKIIEMGVHIDSIQDPAERQRVCDHFDTHCARLQDEKQLDDLSF